MTEAASSEHPATNHGKAKVMLWLRLMRPQFFTAAALPVLVGSATGYFVAGGFDTVVFVMALISMVFLQAGSNIANDYFDHTSGNDWLNKNFNPFSGGSRLIQEGLLSPREVLVAAFVFFGIAIAIGLALVWMTKSLFILGLGVVGFLGGYFYTAGPARLSYRGVGEILIAFLFGILPVYGAYYLQTGLIDLLALPAALIIAILIFLIILINEFPDEHADAGAGKKTLVVIFGARTAVHIYLNALLQSYLIAILAAVYMPRMRLPFLMYLLTLPIAWGAFKYLKEDALNMGGKLRPNKFTVILHLAGGLLIVAGFVISGLFKA